MSGLEDYVRAAFTFNIRRKLKKEKESCINGRSYVNFSNCKFEGYNKVEKFTTLNHVILGFGSYVSENSMFVDTVVGRYCAIGPNVHIITGRHPSREFVSVHPSFYSTARQAGFSYVKENRFEESSYVDLNKNLRVCIGNDVWIGDGVSIMEGVTIADGTIIGAGALVTEGTEPYSIYGGVPARLIRYRFEEEDISFLLKLKWWNKDIEWIKCCAEYFNDIKRLKLFLEEG